MRSILRGWRRSRRYAATVQDLRSLPRAELEQLGIRPEQIESLARKVTFL